MERTTISKTGLRAGAVLLASLALAGCSKDPAGVTVDPDREAVILSIAEVNYGVSAGGSKSAESAQGGDRAGGGTPQTRAIVDGGGSTFFTDGDRLGLFLRGEGYEDVDNRLVQLDYPGEGPNKKWNISGTEIALNSNEATVTAYFPYNATENLPMSAVPLNPGPYDVNTNDLVWQRDKVHSTHTQAMFLDMRHAMTRVKIRLNRSKPLNKAVGDVVDGGVVYWVNPVDATDFRVVALDESSKVWAVSSSYVLGSEAQSQSDRNGAAIMTLAKNYSAETSNGTTGTFATDFPAFGYCYNKTPVGTWYLPSKQELTDLYAAKGSVESVITAHKGTAFTAGFYWSATEFSTSSIASNVSFSNGLTGYTNKADSYSVRCVRSPLASEESDLGAYTGAGEIELLQIADKADSDESDKVIYLDGTLDLTPATPVIKGGEKGPLTTKENRTLSEDGVLYDFLLLPVEHLGQDALELSIVIDKQLQTVPFPVDVIDKWEAGKAYTYEVSIRNGEARVVFDKATVTPWNYGGSISGSLDPSNPEYGGGDVQDWGDNEWEIGHLAVGDVWGGGVVYWVNPVDATDFRVVALDESQKAWAASADYVLGEGAQDETARNGADVWKIAKDYSDKKTGGASGDFATDFPAFAYCYNYQGPDGSDPQGTWYVPSKQELTDLYAAKGSVESVITAKGGTAFSAGYFWSATESSTGSGTAWIVHFSSGYAGYCSNKTFSNYSVRCVRGK